MPIIASLAAEIGALTVAVVTKPFGFEGRRRLQYAERGVEELRNAVDTLITIPNERLLNFVERGTREGKVPGESRKPASLWRIQDGLAG